MKVELPRENFVGPTTQAGMEHKFERRHQQRVEYIIFGGKKRRKLCAFWANAN
jgi:hypothetical protein